ncbi:MAG: accessory Sec system translocase SecA2 [Acidobacteria bacterium]|nr:accessory Sec system translocase SecA2 [Acidobacteriota bacterium]
MPVLTDPAAAYRAATDPEEILALAAAAAERTLNITLFPGQHRCALALTAGRIVEMQTGEGKTVAAMPAAALLAKAGKGLHVLTANDYLAKRDAAWMGPAYAELGLRVAWIGQLSTPEERRRAYEADITYLAATEAGFDHLRDCRTLTRAERVQRPLYAAIVDEADSILIDEARIPLVLAGECEGIAESARRAGPAARAMRQGIDYILDARNQNMEITYEGLSRAEDILQVEQIHDAPNGLLTALYHALHAKHLLTRDVDYLVRDGKIFPIDEYKGRTAKERRWPAGMHAALEEKEGLPIQEPGRVLASATLQNFALQYEHLCGMTGTAATQAEEFQRIYGLDVEVIPTHKPRIRIDYPDVLFPNQAAKFRAIVQSIRERHSTGQPVLIGSESVEASEQISRAIPDIPHNVLNARHEEAEAALIAQAGQCGAVTVSTNMAGRGVDIVLGPGVAELGGLHVIGTARNDSRRIDNQLRGRAGRQGDPGSTRYFIALDDELIHRFRDDGEEIRTLADCDMLQRRAEGRHLDARLFLHKYEQVVEGQRHALLQAREETMTNAGEEPENPEWLIRVDAIDEAWACYLEEVANLKTGFAWLNLGGREPLYAFLHNVDALFNQLWAQVDAETAERLESGESQPPRRGATWTYLTVDQPFGTTMERIVKGLARKARSRSLWG